MSDLNDAFRRLSNVPESTITTGQRWNLGPLYHSTAQITRTAAGIKYFYPAKGVSITVLTGEDSTTNDGYTEQETMDMLEEMVNEATNFNPDTGQYEGTTPAAGSSLTVGQINNFISVTGDPLFLFAARFNAIQTGKELPTLDDLTAEAGTADGTHDFDYGFDLANTAFVEAMAAIAAIPDPVTRETAIRNVAKQIKVPVSSLRNAANASTRFAPLHVGKGLTPAFVARMLPLLSYFLTFGEFFRNALPMLSVKEGTNDVQIDLNKIPNFFDTKADKHGDPYVDFKVPPVVIHSPRFDLSPINANNPDVMDYLIQPKPNLEGIENEVTINTPEELPATQESAVSHDKLDATSDPVSHGFNASPTPSDLEFPLEVPLIQPSGVEIILPSWEALPERMPNVKLDFDLNPHVRSRIAPSPLLRVRMSADYKPNTFARPRSRPEHARRRDVRKEKKSKSKMAYAAMVNLVNQTYGRVSEIKDFYDAVSKGIYVKTGDFEGERLFDLSYDELKLVVLEGDIANVYIDLETIAFELFLTNLSDYIYGYAGSKVAGLENAIFRRSARLAQKGSDTSLEDELLNLLQ